MEGSGEFSGSIVESVQNAVFSKNIKNISGIYNEIDGYIQNLMNDCYSLEQYLDKLKLLKKRGFKVSNAVAKLEYQLKYTKNRTEHLKNQKDNQLLLLCNDLYELTKQVLDYRVMIDDKQDGAIDGYHKEIEKYNHPVEITFDMIQKLAVMSMSHIQDLQDDIYKFDPQIAEAQNYKSRNFDVGDLVETLIQQKKHTQEKYDVYSVFYSETSEKHWKRSQEYLVELKEEAAKVKEKASQQSGENENSKVDVETPVETPKVEVETSEEQVVTPEVESPLPSPSNEDVEEIDS